MKAFLINKKKVIIVKTKGINEITWSYKTNRACYEQSIYLIKMEINFLFSGQSNLIIQGATVKNCIL